MARRSFSLAFSFVCFCVSTFSQHAFAIETEYETIALKLKNGSSVDLKLKIVKSDPKKTKRSVLMIFGGFQNSDQVLEMIDPKDDIILASFTYPFNAPKDKFKLPESLKLLPEAKKTILSTIEGIDLAAKSLQKRKDVNADQITVLGASFGAPFAIYGITKDIKNTPVKGLVVIQGFGKIKEFVKHQIEQKIKPKLGSFASATSWSFANTAWKFVGLTPIESEAKKLKNTQKILMIQAKKDERIPKEFQESLKQAFVSSQAQFEYSQMPGGHLAPGQENRIKSLMKRVTVWMKKNRLL